MKLLLHWTPQLVSDFWYTKNDRSSGAISQIVVLRKRDPEEEDCSLDTPKGNSEDHCSDLEFQFFIAVTRQCYCHNSLQLTLLWKEESASFIEYMQNNKYRESTTSIVLGSLLFSTLQDSSGFGLFIKARHDGYDTNYTFDDILVYAWM